MAKYRNSLIIRLIDVVLLLFFGFVKVSDIVHKKQIKLPDSSAAESSQMSVSRIIPVEIEVLPTNEAIGSFNGSFSSSLIENSQVYSYYVIHDSAKTHRMQQVKELDQYLSDLNASYQAQGDSMLVLIHPDSNSIIQGTVNLIDICRRLNLKRNFMYGIEDKK